MSTRDLYAQCLAILAKDVDELHEVSYLLTAMGITPPVGGVVADVLDHPAGKNDDNKKRKQEQDTASAAAAADNDDADDDEAVEEKAAAGCTSLHIRVATSVRDIEEAVGLAILRHGAVISQQQLTHLINSSAMEKLIPAARLKRVQAVAVWVPTLHGTLDGVLLQQLLSILEDSDPNVFVTGLRIFQKLGETGLLNSPDSSGKTRPAAPSSSTPQQQQLKQKSHPHILRTIFAYLSSQLDARGSQLSLLGPIVNCLTSLPLQGLEVDTLAALLDDVIRLLFQPGLPVEARLSVYRFVADPSRDVADLPWGAAGGLLLRATCVMCLGLGDQAPACVRAAVAGVLHLIGDESGGLQQSQLNAKVGTGNDGELNWVRDLLYRDDVLSQATAPDVASRTAAYSVLSRAIAQCGLNTWMVACARNGVQAFLGKDAVSDVANAQDYPKQHWGGRRLNPCHNASWVAMLLHRMSNGPNASPDDGRIALGLLLGEHGVISRNQGTRTAACEAIVQCCADLNVSADFQVVGVVVEQARRLILGLPSDDSGGKPPGPGFKRQPHVVVGALQLFTHLVPLHLRGLNLWFCGESHMLRRTMNLLTRDPSVEVRCASLGVVRELLLAVPSTIARSSSLVVIPNEM